jgi:hypothetical protein
VDGARIYPRKIGRPPVFAAADGRGFIPGRSVDGLGGERFPGPGFIPGRSVRGRRAALASIIDSAAVAAWPRLLEISADYLRTPPRVMTRAGLPRTKPTTPPAPSPNEANDPAVCVPKRTRRPLCRELPTGAVTRTKPNLRRTGKMVRATSLFSDRCRSPNEANGPGIGSRNEPNRQEAPSPNEANATRCRRRNEPDGPAGRFPIRTRGPRAVLPKRTREPRAALPKRTRRG